MCHTGFLTVCEQDKDGCPARKLSANVYDIYIYRVYSEYLTVRHRICPKHVEPYSKHKLEKLMHLICLIIRITTGLFVFLRL